MLNQNSDPFTQWFDIILLKYGSNAYRENLLKIIKYLVFILLVNGPTRKLKSKYTSIYKTSMHKIITFSAYISILQ
jgi:hypothetical protein